MGYRYSHVYYPCPSLDWRRVENVIDPPHFGHNGPKTQEIAKKLCPGSYVHKVHVHVTSIQRTISELHCLVKRWMRLHKSDPLSKNAHPTKIKFEFEAILSIQVVFQLNSDYYTESVTGGLHCIICGTCCHHVKSCFKLSNAMDSLNHDFTCSSVYTVFFLSMDTT